jgi:hypothetical protein
MLIQEDIFFGYREKGHNEVIDNARLIASIQRRKYKFKTPPSSCGDSAISILGHKSNFDEPTTHCTKGGGPVEAPYFEKNRESHCHKPTLPAPADVSLDLTINEYRFFATSYKALLEARWPHCDSIAIRCPVFSYSQLPRLFA